MDKVPITANPVWNGRNFIINESLCFVMMPFNRPWSGSIFKYLNTVFKNYNFEIKRADSVAGPNIMEDIWRLINESRIVIADITGNNPNVLYELGVAHTLGKNIILLTQTLGEIPFDISNYRHIVYEGDSRAFEVLETELPKHIENILKESPTGIPLIDETIKKMEFWKTQLYDYDYLLKKNVIRNIGKYTDIRRLPEDIWIYCLMSSIYYGMIFEISFWTLNNKSNLNAGKFLSRYITMPYRRPKFRSAFVLQYFETKVQEEALVYLQKNYQNNELIGFIKRNEVKEYVIKNMNKSHHLNKEIGIQLINEFTAIEETISKDLLNSN